MLNLETALALKNAGLKWEPEEGDLFIPDDFPEGVALAVGISTMCFEEGDTWVPRLDQLLAAIEREEFEYRLYPWQGESKCYVCYVSYAKEADQAHRSKIVYADTPEEAAGQALFRILEQKEVE